MYDPHLDMSKQVNNICRSGYASLRNIGAIRRYLTPDATKSLVHALVISRLDYCNALLFGVPQVTLNKLQRLQNTAARIITRTPRSSHITPVLRDLHWLPVERRIMFKVLVLAYKTIHQQAPPYMSDMLEVNRPTRALRSANSLSLVIPRVRTVRFGDREFASAASHMWNDLPCNIQNATTLNTFRTHLKTHLFV